MKSNYKIKITALLLTPILLLLAVCVLCVTTLSRSFAPSPVRMPLLRNPVWSPTGNYLALECSFGGWDLPEYEVCFAKPDLSDITRLQPKTIIRSSKFSQLSWSPMGNQVAFESNDGLIIASTSSMKARVIIEKGCAKPLWSPNAKQLACTFNGFSYPTGGDLVVLDVEQGTYTTLSTSIDKAIMWSRDAQSIYFIRGSGGEKIFALYKINLNSKKHELLASNIPNGVAMSPSELYVVYSTTGSDLELLDLAMSTKMNLLESYGVCFKNIWGIPQWSHNEKDIAFISETGELSRGDIWNFNLPTKKVSRLTSLKTFSSSVLGKPSWSLDDSLIATSFVPQIGGYESVVVNTSPLSSSSPCDQ